MIASLMLYAVVVGLALALAGSMLERAASARSRARRWVWAAMLGALVLTALAGSGLRLSRTTIGGAELEPVAAVQPTDAGLTGGLMAGLSLYARFVAEAEAAGTALASFERLSLWIWLASSIAVALMYVAGLSALRRRRRGWRQASVRGTPVLVAPDTGPAVVGIRSPQIVLPEWALGLPSDALDLMIRHEREHQTARDPLLVRIAGAIVLLMPWNPAVWWLVRRLKLAVEIDCDARVLSAPAVDAAAYGELLLALATRPPGVPIVAWPAMLERPSRLARRIAAMSRDQDPHSYVRTAGAAGAALLVLGAALLVPAPDLRAQTSEPSLAPRLLSVAAQTPAAQPTPESDQDDFGRHAYDLTVPEAERPAGVIFPEPIHSVNPKYTREAMDAKVEGVIEVQVVVEADGTVGDVRAAGSPDDVAAFDLVTSGLVQAALDAAEQWKFEPATLNGVPVAVIVELQMEFRLH